VQGFCPSGVPVRQPTSHKALLLVKKRGDYASRHWLEISPRVKYVGLLWTPSSSSTALNAVMHCRVKCWAFAPPGGLADPHVAEAAQEFCTSVVLGKDWIPRLTVHSFERLRDEMVRTWSALLHEMMSLPDNDACIMK